MRLYDLAGIIRTKNAGPFTITIDMIFNSDSDFEKAAESPSLSTENLAVLYAKKVSDISIHQYQRINAIKITMPRDISSGAPNDRDVYGSQQHFPLANLDI